MKKIALAWIMSLALIFPASAEGLSEESAHEINELINTVLKLQEIPGTTENADYNALYSSILGICGENDGTAQVTTSTVKKSIEVYNQLLRGETPTAEAIDELGLGCLTGTDTLNRELTAQEVEALMGTVPTLSTQEINEIKQSLGLE